MPSREQLTDERVRALLDYLEIKESDPVYSQIRETGEFNEAHAVIADKERQKSVDAIIADYNQAVTDFNAAVTQYENATTDSERINALVNGLLATRAQQEEIVEYLLLGGL